MPKALDIPQGPRVKKRIGQCVYCGEVRSLTDDHVPPQALWSKPRPRDLVVVPACRECNTAASRDDEYFKTMLVLKEGSSRHSEAKAVSDSVVRGLQKPRKAGFRRTVLSSLQVRPLHSKGGVYLGRVPVFDVDLGRLDHVVARLTRGLYWHHFGERLPTDCEVVAWSETGLSDVGSDALDQIRAISSTLLAGEEHRLARDVLRYWYGATEVRDGTVWLFEFYGDVRFLGVTISMQDSEDI